MTVLPTMMKLNFLYIFRSYQKKLNHVTPCTNEFEFYVNLNCSESLRELPRYFHFVLRLNVICVSIFFGDWTAVDSMVVLPDD
jgi:hypothetical protein